MSEPRKRSPTDTPSWSPRTTSTIEGGISWPRVPEATITPEANDLLYPACSMAGREIRPMVVTVAAVTPVVAAIRLPTSTTARARPPLSFPSSCPMACSSRSAMPEV